MASQKEQFHEKGEIFTPESMIFGIPEPQLLSQYSVVQVNNFQPYEKPDTRQPSKYGVFDPALGAFERDKGDCPTCGKERVTFSESIFRPIQGLARSKNLIPKNTEWQP